MGGAKIRHHTTTMADPNNPSPLPKMAAKRSISNLLNETHDDDTSPHCGHLLFERTAPPPEELFKDCSSSDEEDITHQKVPRPSPSTKLESILAAANSNTTTRPSNHHRSDSSEGDHALLPPLICISHSRLLTPLHCHKERQPSDE